MIWPHSRCQKNSTKQTEWCYACYMDLNIRNVDPDLVKALKAFALSRDVTLRDFCLSSLRSSVIIDEEPKNGCVKCGFPERLLELRKVASYAEDPA